MNPLLLAGGAALVLFFLSSKRRHPLVRKGSPYDTAGSSFVPPDQQEGPPPPPSGTGFASRDDGPRLGDDLRRPPPRSRFGMSTVDAGPGMSRARALREQLKAKPAAGPRMFDDLRAAALSASPNDTDKWLALYDSGAPEIMIAMRSWNNVAGDVFGRFSGLGIALPGWTQDLGWAGGLTGAEQQELLGLARQKAETGVDPYSRAADLTPREMLGTIRSAFSRAAPRPDYDIAIMPELIPPTMELYYSAIENADPAARSISFPTEGMMAAARATASQAWNTLSKLSIDVAPPFDELSDAYKRLLTRAALQIVYMGQPETIIEPIITDYVRRAAASQLQAIYDEFPDITPQEAQEKLQSELGLSGPMMDRVGTDAMNLFSQGRDVVNELGKYL